MRVHLKSAFIDESGTLGRSRYVDGSPALLFAPETGEPAWALSTNLGAYALAPRENCVYVKGYGEHEGVAEALVELGAGEVMEHIVFGPFSTTATLVRLNAEIKDWSEEGA